MGLVQGAAISAGFPNPDGRYPDASRDFIGQGAVNVIAGIFRGMPVGGSMSATSLSKAAGARSRLIQARTVPAWPAGTWTSWAVALPGAGGEEHDEQAVWQEIDD